MTYTEKLIKPTEIQSELQPWLPRIRSYDNRQALEQAGLPTMPSRIIAHYWRLNHRPVYVPFSCLTRQQAAICDITHLDRNQLRPADTQIFQQRLRSILPSSLKDLAEISEVAAYSTDEVPDNNNQIREDTSESMKTTTTFYTLQETLRDKLGTSGFDLCNNLINYDTFLYPQRVADLPSDELDQIIMGSLDVIAGHDFLPLDQYVTTDKEDSYLRLLFEKKDSPCSHIELSIPGDNKTVQNHFTYLQLVYQPDLSNQECHLQRLFDEHYHYNLSHSYQGYRA